MSLPCPWRRHGRGPDDVGILGDVDKQLGHGRAGQGMAQPTLIGPDAPEQILQSSTRVAPKDVLVRVVDFFTMSDRITYRVYRTDKSLPRHRRRTSSTVMMSAWSISRAMESVCVTMPSGRLVVMAPRSDVTPCFPGTHTLAESPLAETRFAGEIW